MSDNSKIHWTESTWNPIGGCSRVSRGCENCYAERMAARFSDEGYWGHGYAERTPAGPRWTGKVELIPSKLGQPLRWRKPRMIFVNSTSDLFHESLSNEDIAAVFGVMATCPQHTFQVLTKRAERMREWFEWAGVKSAEWAWPQWVEAAIDHEGLLRWQEVAPSKWSLPLPNVWLGVSAENQATADERIPHLLRTPAAVRFVSAEPLLGSVDLESRGWLLPLSIPDRSMLSNCTHHERPAIGWVITGGESGPAGKIREADLGWFRSIRDQCAYAGTPYFHKQHGGSRMIDGAWGGRELDGRTHDAMPGK